MVSVHFGTGCIKLRTIFQSCKHTIFPIGDNLTFKMDYWGDIIYTRMIVDNDVLVLVKDFNFNQRNFKRWINHQTISNEKYSIVGEIQNNSINL